MSHAEADQMRFSGQPLHLQGSTREFLPSDLMWIATQFSIAPISNLEYFVERGNINLHTFEIVSEPGTHYLLQRINDDVFAQPQRVMDAMTRWITAQRSYLASGKAPDWTVWEPITLVPTIHGSDYLDLSDASGASVWRMMVKIPDSVSYKSLSEVHPSYRLSLAEEVGRGLALNADLVSPIETESLVSSLPGYRNTRYYYDQFHAVLEGHIEPTYLPEDPEVRAATQNLYSLAIAPSEARERREDPELAPFIQLLLEREEWAVRICDGVSNGAIRQTAIHGDTKIENFLFCKESGRVRSLVDLDTIMPYTWLADWGDMMRSLCNVAGEKERDLDLVVVDHEVYEAVARGFLSTAREVTEDEIALMVDAVQTITLELGLRFLTDYLRGDNYFALGEGDPEDLNKVRALVQLTLFNRLVEHAEKAERILVSARGTLQ